MNSKAGLSELVRQLVEAENQRDRKKAHDILAKNFTAITRARGEEQQRAALLNEIANPRNPNELRRLHPRPWERKFGDLGVVRSLVTTTDRTTQAELGKFRNIHVFQRQGGRWQCVAWQVSRLK